MTRIYCRILITRHNNGFTVLTENFIVQIIFFRLVDTAGFFFMFDHDIFLIFKCLGHRCDFESRNFVDLAKKIYPISVHYHCINLC